MFLLAQMNDEELQLVMCRLRPEARSPAKPGQKKPGQAGPNFLAWLGFWPGLSFDKAKAAGLGPGFCRYIHFIIFIFIFKKLIFFINHIIIYVHLCHIVMEHNTLINHHLHHHDNDDRDDHDEDGEQERPGRRTRATRTENENDEDEDKARDALASRALGMFYFLLFYYN
jgi:hypothetical protein